MTIDESILLMTTLFYPGADQFGAYGNFEYAMEKANRVMQRVMLDPPHTHFATSVALAAAQVMVKCPELTEEQCISNAKTLHLFIQQQTRESFNEILKKASANANGGNSQGKGGCGESPELEH